MRGNKSRTSVLLFVLVVIASSAVLFYLSHSRSQATPTIKQDGSGVYNLGRTLPIKFQLTDANNIFVANATSSPVSPGSIATATASNLKNGSYRWRARAVDSITNAASDWQEFGTPGNTDFVVRATKRVAVILAQTNDKFLAAIHNKAYFENEIIPKVNDYYCENSFGTRDDQGNCSGGKIRFNFRVFDNNGQNYTLTRPFLFYSRENASTSFISFDNTDVFVNDAVLAAANDIDYSQYDITIVVYPGDYCASDECLYNAYFLSPITVSSNEIAQNPISLSENRFLGSWAHELGHALGNLARGKPLCDLYQLTIISCDYIGYRIQNWDLMANGSLLGNPIGTTPSHLSSFSKNNLGLLGFSDIAPGNYSINSLETANPNDRTKRFVISPNAAYFFEGRTTNSTYSKWDTAQKEANLTDALLVYKFNSATGITVLNLLKALDASNGSLVDYENNLAVFANGTIPTTAQKLAFNFGFAPLNPTLAAGFILHPENTMVAQLQLANPFFMESSPADATSGLVVFTEQSSFGKDWNIGVVVENRFEKNITFNNYLENGRIAIQRKQPDGSWDYVWKNAQKEWPPEDAPEDVRETFGELRPGQATELGVASADEIGDGTYRLALGYSFEPLHGLYPDRSKLLIAYSNEFTVQLGNKAAATATATTETPSIHQEISTWNVLIIFIKDYWPTGVLTVFLIILFYLRSAASSARQRNIVTISIFVVIVAVLVFVVFALKRSHPQTPPINQNTTFIENRSIPNIEYLSPALSVKSDKSRIDFVPEEFSTDFSQVTPDLDLHAVTPDGKHVGMNYQTGQYENQIPGAVSSGNLAYDDEWIFVPAGIQVKYYVSSYNIAQFMSGNPNIASRLATTTETYTAQAMFYDSQSNKFISEPLTNQLIAPAQNVVHTVSGTSTITVFPGVVYNFGGFLPPIKTDGTGLYKQGRTLPVKFQLTDANGNFISTAVARLTAIKVQSGIIGTTAVALSPLAGDIGNIFRYDDSANQYVYNFDTGKLTTGTWQINVALDDGKNYTVLISLR